MDIVKIKITIMNEYTLIFPENNQLRQMGAHATSIDELKDFLLKTKNKVLGDSPVYRIIPKKIFHKIHGQAIILHINGWTLDKLEFEIERIHSRELPNCVIIPANDPLITFGS